MFLHQHPCPEHPFWQYLLILGFPPGGGKYGEMDITLGWEFTDLGLNTALLLPGCVTQTGHFTSLPPNKMGIKMAFSWESITQIQLQLLCVTWHGICALPRMFLGAKQSMLEVQGPVAVADTHTRQNTWSSARMKWTQSYYLYHSHKVCFVRNTRLRELSFKRRVQIEIIEKKNASDPFVSG